jgi:uncharacterized protein YbjT (DUF2867 family)
VTKTAFVAGAGGAVGEAAVHALIATGWRVIASVRTPRTPALQRLQAAGARVVMQDLSCDPHWHRAADGAGALVFTTHLTLTLRALESAHVGADTRVVAFSSNNIAVHPEAAAYRELAAAEHALQQRVANLTIIRPTLIYGDPRLTTVTRLMRLARRWPVLPVPGAGRARVQPVFAADLGDAAAAAVEASGTGLFAIGGPDIVTMREFIAAAGRAIRRRVLLVHVPNFLLSAVGRLLPAAAIADQAARADRNRVAAPQSPLPPYMVARTSLRSGLARHAAALLAEGG